LFVLAVICSGALCFAADKIDEEVTPRSRKIFIEPKKGMWESGKIKFLVAATLGYDNNAYLDSQRVGDAYTQQFLKAAFLSPLSKKTDLELEYEFMNLLYADEEDLDLVRNGIRAGLEHKLNKDFTLSGGYNLDIIEYTNTGKDDYIENMFDFKIRQQMSKKMFQSLEYDIFYRSFSRRHTRDPVGAEMLDRERNDLRNVFEYEIGRYFEKDLIKLTLEYFINNSNEKYLDYYDYDSFKIGASFMHLFSQKTTGYFSLSRQYRDYDHRTLINDTSAKQEDRTYLATVGLYHTFNRELSMGLSYTYRQNKSNEPIDRYSGSLTSVSMYYRF
jgi:hypothetical protein